MLIILLFLRVDEVRNSPNEVFLNVFYALFKDKGRLGGRVGEWGAKPKTHKQTKNWKN